MIGSFNEASVWDFFGLTDSVVVALVDNGVVHHEDLPAARVLQGASYVGGGHGEPDAHSGHGMACAGIIASSHTTDSVTGLSTASGVISLNPNTLIKPVKIFDDSGSAAGVSPSDLAAAITYAYASGADVLSNSWGYFGTCPAALRRWTIYRSTSPKAPPYPFNMSATPVPD